MKRSVLFSIVFGACILLLTLPQVFSSPIFQLTTYQEWLDAESAGRIQPVTAWDNGFESHYPGMSSQLRIPNLEVMPDIPQEPGIPGLVMAWGSSADDGQEIIAAWQYEYPQDPDLTGALIHLCVFPPCSVIQTISFGLKDINGKVKSWDWCVDNNPAVPPCVPCDTQICFWINASGGAGQAGATSYWIDVGFDITKVQWLVFDENAIWVDSLQPDPAGFGQNAWNYWKEIWVEFPFPVEESTWGRIKELYKGDTPEE
jgi:hypothetical protein